MFDIIREAPLGMIVNRLTGDRVFRHPEDAPGFEWIPRSLKFVEKRIPTQSVVDESLAVTPASTKSETIVDQTDVLDQLDPLTVVDWYDDNDPDDPYNWSMLKKCFVAGQIMLMTFAVYGGSSIYTSSIPGIMERFNVGVVTGTAGLSLYVLGYSFGPMLLAPLQELPKYGRNPIYMASLFIYIGFVIASAVASNIETILVARFFAGFFGSPVLATGAASIADVFGNKPLIVPAAVGLYAIGAVLGPTLTPFIGGYAAMRFGWTAPNWILAGVSGFAFIVLFVFFPETHRPNVLYRRSRRLRRVTGNPKLVPRQAGSGKKLSVKETLWLPIGISLEPAPLLLGIYLGFVYALFYLFFESFPLVFGNIYGFNLGEQGLAFLGYLVTAFFTYTSYVLYLRYRIRPLSDSGHMTPEDRLEIGLIASTLIPVSTLIYGWTARESVHWIVPVIGASLYLPGVYLIFQSILIYVGTSYATFAASAMAGNTLLRSVIASVFPLFGHAFYENLGLGPGSTLLAGISIILIVPLWLIKRHGATLRAKSKYSDYDPNTVVTAH
ncbi:hypothetical protein FFLO_00883 [Filobasidium floriforme]|uniref:Major facilitator superfamily (MFS) profile domain-containing protein n=1 Tax=Filobasidium floriforme TaxID=5210 RepID=A0A8K0NQK2_9TREE|nr:major facilitator superfamily domain-containing protein [Filobasidium floriforme]KAG7571210.1 hypothetical protein FFLO_00883 [Filobasidium floriforme]KAH8087049.1 major facilitator superfamily domain-containing protein [Filobasidium floriforme]